MIIINGWSWTNTGNEFMLSKHGKWIRVVTQLTHLTNSWLITNIWKHWTRTSYKSNVTTEHKTEQRKGREKTRWKVDLVAKQLPRLCPTFCQFLTTDLSAEALDIIWFQGDLLIYLFTNSVLPSDKSKNSCPVNVLLSRSSHRQRFEVRG